jgi:glycogen debranching enzyme
VAIDVIPNAVMPDAAMPDVWGPGQLLAMSGVDGPTNWAQPFVLATGASPASLEVRLPVAARISFSATQEIVWERILGDVLIGHTSHGVFGAAFADHHTLIGQVPLGAVMHVDDTPVGESPALVAGDGEARLFAFQWDDRWALMLRFADEVPAETSHASVEQIVAARSEFVLTRPMPSGLDADQTRLLRKAISVMKVNVHSPNGEILRRWSTPDRWPHQHMWLWDSAFHAVGMSTIDPALAQDEILAMLEAVDESGMLPHMVQADGHTSKITQPPILAWATLHVLDHGGDPDWARQCLPLLTRYLEWDLAHRDQNGNGIPEWFIEGNPLCRCGESGQDNSSVYDKAVLLDAPDFGAFLCNDFRCLADIAERLDESAAAGRARDLSDKTAAAIEQLLWSEEHELYCHRTFDGQHVPVKTISGFMPLFAGIPSPDRAAALVSHLENPSTFGAPAPVPSESLDSGTYCKDMWRGPTWMNLSYLVVLGLRRYGYTQQAQVLKGKMLDTVGRWYAETGCLYEYYDSLGVTPPGDLDRKQRLISGKGMAPISDYHWTAALTTALLMES